MSQPSPDLDPAFHDLLGLAAATCSAPAALVAEYRDGACRIRASIGMAPDARVPALRFPDVSAGGSLLVLGNPYAEPAAPMPQGVETAAGAGRFLAAVALQPAQEGPVGFLAVVDVRARSLAGSEAEALTRLARLAAAQLELAESRGTISRRTEERDTAHAQDARTGSILQATLESTADGILAVDQEGRILAYNRTFASLWSLPPELLARRDDGAAVRHVLAMVRDPDGFEARIAEMYATPEAESHEEIELLDGRVIQRDSRPQRIDGRVAGRVWSFRDITERRCAEAALRAARDELEERVASRTADLRAAVDALQGEIRERQNAEVELQRREEHFRSLIENASDLITILDPAGTVRYQSPSVRSLLGYGPPDLVGRSVFDLVHPGDRVATREHLDRVVAEPGRPQRTELRIRHGDGRWRVLEAVGCTLRPDSATEGVVVNSRDVTERRRAEEVLRFQTTLLEAQNHTAIDGILVVNDGRVLGMNQRYADLFDVPTELRQPGRGVDLLRWTRTQAADPAAYRAKIEELRSDPEAVGRDEVLLRDGRVLDRYTAPLRSADGRSYGRIWVIRDISDRKRTEEALRAAKEEAERANQAKSEFLSRMSHELRTPMNSILGFAQLLARRELPPVEARGVDHILRAGRHLLNLINEVLDIARIESNRQPLSLEPVLAAAALQESLGLIRPLAAQNDCEVGDPAVPRDLYLRADRQRLTQVLLNLLSNAVKYNRPGGRVWLSCEADDERVRIRVHDTGRGIPAARLSELFVPFSRLGAEESGVEGTGLGLALSQRLIEAMDGALRVESTPEVGSVFEIDLPRDESPLERLVGTTWTAPTSGASTVPGPPRTILYIEDNLANWCLVETIFSGRPEVQLLPALQGRLGLDLAREHLPHLVLLDLHLPDIPGEVVLRELKADPRTRDIPVLVVSADATLHQIERLREAGALDYLTKPIDVEAFIAAVDGVIRPPEALSA